jgi:hypothetical protein
MLVECQHCEATVDGKVIANYEDEDERSGMKGKYSFLKCPRCARPFLELQVDDGAGWDEPLRIHPPRDASISTSIPEPIRLAYEEARTCFRDKAYTAAAIMCRKTLEGICGEHKITSHNLAASLKEMRDQGIIERRLSHCWNMYLRFKTDSSNSRNEEAALMLLPNQALPAKRKSAAGLRQAD